MGTCEELKLATTAIKFKFRAEQTLLFFKFPFDYNSRAYYLWIWDLQDSGDLHSAIIPFI